MTPKLAGVVATDKPVIDGFCFDDLYGYGRAEQLAIIQRGYAYTTLFKAVDTKGRIGTYGGVILARDWHAAEEEADYRGLGERVVGTLS